MRKHAFWVICALLVLAILVWRIADSRGELGTDLLFGWAYFALRVLPNVHIRWDGVLMFVALLVATALLFHFFMRWLIRASGKRTSEAERTWRWRWTLVITGLTVVMFIAGISMIGAAHQLAWLIASDKPLYERDAALPRTDRSSSSLRYIATGLSEHSDTYGTVPTYARNNSGEVRHSWVTYALPFLGWSAEIDMSRPWDDPVNAAQFKTLVPDLINPDFRTVPLRDRRGYGLNHYAGNKRILDSDKRIPTDQSSNTLLIGEVNSKFVPWGQPDNSRDPTMGIHTPGGFGGANPRGAYFALLDGSVEFINKDVDPRVLEQMAGPDQASPALPISSP